MLSCMPRDRCSFTPRILLLFSLLLIAMMNVRLMLLLLLAVTAAFVVVLVVDVLGKSRFSCVLCAEGMVRSTAPEQRPSLQLHELV